MKSVLVTGGSRGIGRACVEKFAANGYNTIFFFKDDLEAAEDVTEKTGAKGIRCDVSDPGDVEKAFDEALSLAGGTLDAAVLNAGVSLKGQIQDLTSDDWEKLCGTDLSGMVYVSGKVAGPMISRKASSIVMVSSMWGITGASCEAAYSAAKAGVIGLGKSLAKELGPSGIRVNIVAPGVIDTDMNKSYSQEDIDRLAEETPLGRIGKPSEVAELIYFLSSENASFITGQTIGIDGGFVV